MAKLNPHKSKKFKESSSNSTKSKGISSPQGKNLKKIVKSKERFQPQKNGDILVSEENRESQEAS